MTNNLMSPQQAKAALVRKGMSAADLARQKNFSLHLVYAVLSGRSKALRGEGHRIAVALGIKDGEAA